MLKAVKGYYNGSNIVMNEHIPLQQGQEVIITVDIIDNTPNKKVDLSRFRGYGKKMFNTDAAEYIKDLRKDDRI